MIYYPKNYGIYSCTNKQLDIAISLSKEYSDKTIYVLNDNKNLKDLLKNTNIKLINNYKNLKENDILVLNYYGEKKETYEYLNKNKILFYESCSSYIEKTREDIENNYNQNINIIIVGNKNSMEVINYNSFCNNESLIIENTNDYKLINKNNYYICYTMQTNINELNDLQNYLNENHIDYELDNSIYERQINIEKDTIDLSQTVDKLILVIMII